VIGILQRQIQTPISTLLVQADEEGLLSVEFAESIRFALPAEDEPPLPPRGQAQSHPAELIRIQRHLDRFESELKAYFDGELMEFKTPIKLRGTEFQQAVYRELLKIPYGHTNAYETIARKLGDERKTRAVGQANARNCLAIIVPCHRVIRADGKIGGYGGGLWRKQRLLELESGALRLI